MKKLMVGVRAGAGDFVASFLSWSEQYALQTKNLTVLSFASQFIVLTASVLAVSSLPHNVVLTASALAGVKLKSLSDYAGAKQKG